MLGYTSKKKAIALLDRTEEICLERGVRGGSTEHYDGSVCILGGLALADGHHHSYYYSNSVPKKVKSALFEAGQEQGINFYGSGDTYSLHQITDGKIECTYEDDKLIQNDRGEEVTLNVIKRAKELV